MPENEPTQPAKSDTPPATESPAAEASTPSTAPQVPSSQPPAVAAIDQLKARQAIEDDEVERTLWTGGYSPKAMIGSWVLCVIASLALLVVAVMYEWLPITWALIAIAVLWVVVGLVYAYRRLGMAYELTTQRFIHQSGVLSRRTDRIEVIDIDDVAYRQGPVQRMLGVGVIDIESSDRSHPSLRMRGIANVRDVAGLIDDIRRKERRRRSLHIEAI